MKCSPASPPVAALHIATSKRIHPARLILRHLGWAGLFEKRLCLDLFRTALKDKAAMIRRLLEDQQIPLGDASTSATAEDGSSARRLTPALHCRDLGIWRAPPPRAAPDLAHGQNPRPSRRCSDRTSAPPLPPTGFSRSVARPRALRRCRVDIPYWLHQHRPVPGATIAATWRRRCSWASTPGRIRTQLPRRGVPGAHSRLQPTGLHGRLRKCFRTYRQQMIFVRAIRPQGSAPEAKDTLAANPYARQSFAQKRS